ncbi:MAG: tripartite tricarboxylate transporter substrate binding protein [Mailhella sp.]|nr:tripartite tricarboxylate transporter substrate binding protein [Mailhella sp.]
MKMVSKFLMALGLAGMMVMPATAADYPSKPINMIIAFTAGGSSDVQARIMQKYWNKYNPDQGWVFIYKPGAGGMIGFTEIAKAKPDGYTIGGMNVPHIVLQTLGQKAQFNALDSFKYICQVVNDSQVVAVRKDSPYKSAKEVFDAAKANPGKVKLGLVGPMSGHHLMYLDAQKQYPESKFAPVFYKGAADQNAAILGGEIDVMFGNLNDVMRSIEELRVLGIAADKENTQFLPGVPTLKSQGYDLVSDIRRCFAAPKDIAPEHLAKLRAIFKQICEDKDYIAEMVKAGQPEQYMDGEAFHAWVKTQFAKSEKLLNDAGLLKK